MAGTQTIYLGTVLWDNTYSDVVNFETREQRDSYFTTAKASGGLGFTNLPLSRPFNESEGVIVISRDYYQTYQGDRPNYMIVETYKDDDTHKLFAFIIDIEPDGDSTMIITFEKDFWQSNLFIQPSAHGFTNNTKKAMDIRSAFVIREHRDRWETTPIVLSTGYRLKPKERYMNEGLETGRFIQQSAKEIETNIYSVSGYTLKITPHLLFSVKPSDENNPINRTTIAGNSDAISTYLFFDVKKKVDGEFVRLDRERIYVGITLLSGVTMSNIETKNLINATHPFSLDEFYGTGDPLDIKGDYVLGVVPLPVNTFKLEIKNVGIKTQGNQEYPYLYIRYDDGDSNAISYYEYKTSGDFFYNAIKLGDVNKKHTQEVLLRGNDHLLLRTVDFADFTNDERPHKRVVVGYESVLYNDEFKRVMVGNYKAEPLYLTTEKNINAHDKIIYTASLNLWLQDELQVYYSGVPVSYYDRVRNKINNTPVITSDEYKIYYQNNKNQINTTEQLGTKRTVQGAVMVGVGTAVAVSGLSRFGGLGMALSGVNMMIQAQNAKQMSIAKSADYMNKADEVKNNQNSYMLDEINNSTNYMLITQEPEYKDTLLNYFYYNGYKTNKQKRPDLESRYWFNFIQTANVKIRPDNINSVDRQILEQIYMGGVTIWHYRETNKHLFNVTFNGYYIRPNTEMSFIRNGNVPLD